MKRREFGMSTVFILTACFNFVVGAFLGGWMASIPSMIGSLIHLHAEINPYGFLTMMIYGMTYAVIQMATGYRPPIAWITVIHYLLSEVGVLLLVLYAMKDAGTSVYLIGLSAQVVASFVFLFQLLSAIIIGKKKGRQFQTDLLKEDTFLSAMRGQDALKATDQIGQRGTDIALLLYLAVSLLILIQTFLSLTTFSYLGTPSDQLLIDFGWLGGTVWSVGLHLYTRFFPQVRLKAKWLSLLQILYFSCVILSAILFNVTATSYELATRALGVVILLFSATFLWSIRIQGRSNVQRISQVGWLIAFVFSTVLGLLLLIGYDPLAIAVLHSLFLGMITTLIYAIGYTVFPSFFKKGTPPPVLCWIQLGMATIGCATMILAMMMATINLGMLAVGGILAATAAFLFLFIWIMLNLKNSKNVVQ